LTSGPNFALIKEDIAPRGRCTGKSVEDTNIMRDRMYYSKEAQTRAQRDRLLMVAVVSLLGVAIGAVVMLLFAPRSGDETRQTIANAVGDAVERSGEASQAAVKQLNEELNELRQRLESRGDAR